MPVIVGSRVGVAEIVPIGIAQRVLDRGLVGRILDFVQLLRPVDAIVRRVALRPRAIRGRTVCAGALVGPVTVAAVRIELGTGSVGRRGSRRIYRAQRLRNSFGIRLHCSRSHRRRRRPSRLRPGCSRSSSARILRGTGLRALPLRNAVGPAWSRGRRRWGVRAAHVTAHRHATHDTRCGGGGLVVVGRRRRLIPHVAVGGRLLVVAGVFGRGRVGKPVFGGRVGGIRPASGAVGIGMVIRRCIRTRVTVTRRIRGAVRRAALGGCSGVTGSAWRGVGRRRRVGRSRGRRRLDSAR